MERNAAIQLALETLGTFNLQEKLLVEFVREVVVGFLDDDSPYALSPPPARPPARPHSSSSAI
jgi:hypothetical protein